MKKRIEIKIRGIVQGVLFRQSTKELADRLHIVGFARNEKDGTVTIVAEGEEKALDELIRFTQRGPQHAQVENIDILRNQITHDFEHFNVSIVSERDV